MGRNFSSIMRIGGRAAFIVAAALTLANCKTTGSSVDPKYGVTASPRKHNDGDAIPKGNGRYHVGKPYVIAGITYVPEENPSYRADGIASWYGDAFHGRLTSNGEVFDMRSITAAHPTLPLPSYVRVTNLSNGRSLVVRVNDRGPFHADRVSLTSAHCGGRCRHLVLGTLILPAMISCLSCSMRARTSSGMSFLLRSS